MFKRKPKAPNEAEFRGPLDIFPGDRVLYYQQELTLAGVIILAQRKERRCQYHFLDADGLHTVIAFGAGDDPRITLEHALAEDDRPDHSEDTLDLDGTTFALEPVLEAYAFRFGGIPMEKRETATCRTFVDEDEMEILVAEDWHGYVEVRRGEAIHENELVVKRQRDGEDWEIKPPPQIDLRSLNEARRSKQIEARAKVERAQVDDLAAARAKLAAFEDDAPLEEDEGLVNLSEIVDVHQRFEEEEPAPPPAEPPAGELPAEEPAEEEPAEPVRTVSADDPFSSVFEEDEVDRAADPYQDYMDPEREGEFGEETPAPVESGPLFPEAEAEAEKPEEKPVDEEREEFLNAGIFGDDEDDDLS
ncbi:MAG: hypothetical protein ABFS86_04130 [Planctomycetota bacterium]